ncbi:P-loop containing nucleoside triphosphate hydrolase [Tanacetum coccineum]
MGLTPLRRSERGKNPVDVHASNVKSTEKSRDISKEIAEEGSRDSNETRKNEKIGSTPLRRSESGKNPVDVPASNVKSIEKSMVTEEGSRDSNGGSKKWKWYDAGEFKSQKSPRFHKQIGPTTWSAIKKKKPEKSEKIGSTPLRRSERGKNHVGQVVVNDEISLTGPAHKTQIVDLMESGKEDQESREVAPALFGNLIKAESHHKPMHDMCLVVVLGGVVNLSDSSNDMVSDPHTSEKHMTNATVISKPIGEAPAKQDANMVNDVEGADTTVFSESIVDIPAKHDADATVLSEPIGDIPAIEEIASEQQDEVENVVSGDDAMVSSERIGDISAKHDADIDMAPNDYSADMSHAVEDPNKNGSNDISLHADSDQMGIPAANDLTPHIEYADGSHAVEDPNGTRPNHVAPNVRSVELGIPAGNCNQEKAEDTTPSVQQVASPVSDHSMPAIPEIHNDSHLLQQPTEDRIQDQEGQADHTPMVEIEDDNMQNVEAIQVDQIIPEESSLNPHNEPSSVMSANPTITENQAAMLPTSEVLAQTTAAQTQIQRNANFNQVASQMPRRVDPLHIELEQLSSVKEKMIKSYHDCIQKINIGCEKEIAEAIAEIRLKYHNKRQEADATFNSRKKEVESNMYIVVINQVLAATFRQKCQDVSSGCVALQQGVLF